METQLTEYRGRRGEERKNDDADAWFYWNHTRHCSAFLLGSKFLLKFTEGCGNRSILYENGERRTENISVSEIVRFKFVDIYLFYSSFHQTCSYFLVGCSDFISVISYIVMINGIKLKVISRDMSQDIVIQSEGATLIKCCWWDAFEFYLSSALSASYINMFP